MSKTFPLHPFTKPVVCYVFHTFSCHTAPLRCSLSIVQNLDYYSNYEEMQTCKFMLLQIIRKTVQVKVSHYPGCLSHTRTCQTESSFANVKFSLRKLQMALFLLLSLVSFVKIGLGRHPVRVIVVAALVVDQMDCSILVQTHHQNRSDLPYLQGQ
jgi:hypothetical protein